MTEKTMSLGKQLKEQAKARAEAARQQADREAQLAALALTAKRKRAFEFFDAAKVHVKLAVANGAELRTLPIPDEFRDYRRDSLTRRDVYFNDCSDEVFAFRRWCNENDLAFGFAEDHDGMGMRSWGVLKITPKG